MQVPCYKLRRAMLGVWDAIPFGLSSCLPTFQRAHNANLVMAFVTFSRAALSTSSRKSSVHLFVLNSWMRMMPKSIPLTSVSHWWVLLEAF